MRFRTLFLLSLITISINACEGPTAGEITIDLVAPSSGEGAILFKIETPTSNALGEITAACPGCQAFPYRIGDSEVYCVVTGALTSGPLAKMVVANVGLRSGYFVTIVEVADAEYGLRSTTDYGLRLSH